ncbi:MAG: hypothetical protein LBV08_07525 [Clostridiales bacterium]|jgi:hypothetical protein|nr:hypothetical protein [Clostridiales bacterium]
MGILAVYDTVGIQDFIFSSNKLAENVGASKLVADVFCLEGGPLPQVIESVTKKSPTAWGVNDKLNPELKAEVVYQGGGNSFVAFDSEEIFQEVTKKFLVEVRKKAPGIGIAVAAVETDFKDTYKSDYQSLMSRLALTKGKFNIPVFAGNQPITKQSERTALPVSSFDTVFKKEPKEYMSIDQLAKRNSYEEYLKKEYLKKENANNPEEGSVIRNFNGLAFDKDKDSLIAIIHADGNNMGNRIIEYMKDVNSYDEAVPKMRRMSERISKCYKKAFNTTVEAFKKQHNSYLDLLQMNINSPEEVPMPLIELINDGDDITVVICGRFAIDFAARLLREIEKIEKEESPFENLEDPQLTACAGVVIYHCHYPFSEAYKLAESLCKSAKEPSRTSNGKGSYIDFQLHTSGNIASLEQLRGRQYEVGGKSILRRPWRVSSGIEDEYPNFKLFEEDMKIIKAPNMPKGKLKALKNAISISNGAAEEAGNQISELNLLQTIKQEKEKAGSNSIYVPLFDMLELCDNYENLLNTEGSNL